MRMAIRRGQSDGSGETKVERARRKRSVFTVVNALIVLAIFFVFAAAAFASVLGVIMLQDITRDLPPIDRMREYTPSLTSIIYDRKGREIARLFEENRTWIDIGTVSPWAKSAVLAAEDSEFYAHRGLRLTAIFRALLADIRSGSAAQGGSTITQQVARMLFLNRDRTLQRKAAEAIIAVRMERMYTKDHILEMYLNMAYFGHGAYGLAAASQNYFGKSPATLSLAEASMLAGLLPAPNLYTPLRHPDRAKVRQNYVLTRMVETGVITEAEKQAALAAKLTYARTAESRVSFVMDQAPHFVSHVLFQRLLPKYGRDRIYRGGLRIHTTIDLEMQQHAEAVLAKQKFEGAIVAIDPNTGEILAMAGGRDFGTSKFNRATQAYRQPGSSFKPIAYAAAFESGYRPVDRIFDAPIVFPNGWAPKNSDGKFIGETTLADALCRSINTPAVRLTQVIGVETICDQATAMGITTPYLVHDLSVVLGSSSVTPLEMCAAFSTFSNGGNKVVPYSIKEITDSNGNVVEQTGPTLSTAMSPETSVTMRSLLMQAVAWGTGTRAKLDGYQTFGKTGTTNDFTDVWFVGGAPSLSAVVYMGNDNHKTMGRAFGGTVAAPVWKEFMQKAVSIAGTPKEFSTQSGIGVQSVSICRETGYLTASGCTKKATMLIAVGQAPETRCPRHGGNMSAARGDSNAPLFILGPYDGDLRASIGKDDPTETPVVEITAPAVTETVPLPPPHVEPYKNDPTPADDVNARFNELLEKYGLKD